MYNIFLKKIFFRSFIETIIQQRNILFFFNLSLLSILLGFLIFLSSLCICISLNTWTIKIANKNVFFISAKWNQKMIEKFFNFINKYKFPQICVTIKCELTNFVLL